MKELNDIQPVCDCLGTWLGQIRARSALDFYDINQVSENTAAALLNLVFKREFKNLNKERKHFPGIDLGDDTNKEPMVPGKLFLQKGRGCSSMRF
jgi:hypothetical protein